MCRSLFHHLSPDDDAESLIIPSVVSDISAGAYSFMCRSFIYHPIEEIAEGRRLPIV